MTVQNPAIFLQEGSHPAEDVRRALGSIVGQAGGLVSGSDLVVSENSAGADLSIDVAGGAIWLAGTESTYQGVYYCENRGVTNIPVQAADVVDPRIDLVVARVYDSSYSGTQDEWSLDIVTGTPASSPVAPSLPANSYSLATISVAANATTVVDANITDTRTLTDETITGNLNVGGDIAVTGDLTVTGNINGKSQTKVTMVRDSFVIPSNTNTTLAFGTGTTVIDTDNFHSETTNNSRITVDEDGVYLINVSVYDLLSSDRALLNLYKGGSIIGSFDSGAGGTHNDFTFTLVHKTDVGEYFTVVLYQNSGADRTTDVDFSVTLLHSI